MDLIAFSVGLLALLAASIHDFKTREVPDLLSYGLIAFAITYGVGKAVILQSWTPLFQMLGGLTLMVTIGYIMFYAGQWGGADSKLLMALGALLGIGFGSFNALWFLLVALLSGALYGLLYTIILAIQHRKEFVPAIKKRMTDPLIKWFRRIVLFVVLLLLISLFFVPKLYQPFTLLLLVAVYGLFYLWLLVHTIENAILIKMYPIKQLTEGDWIAKDVFIKKKLIVGPKSLGISKKQIQLLKKSKIKQVLVKEGIPFVPSFLLAWILFWILAPYFPLF